jgi:cell division protein FtsQ
MWDKPIKLNLIANLLFMISVLAIIYSIGFAVATSSRFPLKEVKIEGNLQHTTLEQVKLIVEKRLKGNFFTVDLALTREAFEKLPWVRNVSLRRRWPDRLDVVVEEHEPLARWKTTAIVNTHGELFYAADGDDLPVLIGPDDAVIQMVDSYHVFNQMLAPLNMKVTQVTLTERQAWQLVTNGALTIELGSEQDKARLNRFVTVYQNTIASLKKKITYADLRYPNGFAIRKPAL